jgi:hypothetical protein
VLAAAAPVGSPAVLAGALAEEQLLAVLAPGVVVAAAGAACLVPGSPGALPATQLGGACASASKSRRRLVVLPEPPAAAAVVVGLLLLCLLGGAAAAATAGLLLLCLLAGAGAAAAGPRRLMVDVLLLLGSRLLAATLGLVRWLAELRKLMCCLLPTAAGRTEAAVPAAAVMTPGRREAAAVPGLLLCSLRMVWKSVSASEGSDAFHLVLLLQAGCSSRRRLLVVLLILAVGLGGAEGPVQLLLPARCSPAASSATPAAAADGILLLHRADANAAEARAT